MFSEEESALNQAISATIKVDIWSDIRCPFCYIGKRKFEMGLAQFQNRKNVIIEWHSFELDPNLETERDKNINDYLAERKGIPLERAEKMHEQVTQTASEVGLVYNFEKTVVANSFDAHRLIQLAKTEGLGDTVEENLFKSYFTDGKDISDKDTLIYIGVRSGLEEKKITDMLDGDSFKGEVRSDEVTANRIGVQGVPFFVFNNKYGVSGAQAPEVFLDALEQVWKEGKEQA